VVAEIRRSNNPDLGFDASSKKVSDLRAAGVLDSADGVSSALRIAFSYARQVLETERWDLDTESGSTPRSDLPGLPEDDE
jgi:chaperonin GroEL (HSP60 family)